MKKLARQIALLVFLLPTLPLSFPQLPMRPALQQCVNAVITSPRDGAVLRGGVGVFGSAAIQDFQFYKVEFAPSFSPEQWSALPGSTTYARQVNNARLDIFDTSRVPDGTYSLKLTVVDRRAQEVCRAFVRNILVANSEPPTPTPEPTDESTPTPESTLTPVVQGTPAAALAKMTIAIAQPPTATRPVAVASSGAAQAPTRAPSSLPNTDEILGIFDAGRLREAFVLGAGATLGIFVLIGLIAFIRRLL